MPFVTHEVNFERTLIRSELSLMKGREERRSVLKKTQIDSIPLTEKKILKRENPIGLREPRPRRKARRRKRRVRTKGRRRRQLNPHKRRTSKQKEKKGPRWWRQRLSARSSREKKKKRQVRGGGKKTNAQASDSLGKGRPEKVCTVRGGLVVIGGGGKIGQRGGVHRPLAHEQKKRERDNSTTHGFERQGERTVVVLGEVIASRRPRPGGGKAGVLQKKLLSMGGKGEKYRHVGLENSYASSRPRVCREGGGSFEGGQAAHFHGQTERKGGRAFEGVPCLGLAERKKEVAQAQLLTQGWREEEPASVSRNRAFPLSKKKGSAEGNSKCSAPGASCEEGIH